jgi:hypothetical protein
LSLVTPLMMLKSFPWSRLLLFRRQKFPDL